MEDALIVDLYWARDEQGLAETAAKFGTLCRKKHAIYFCAAIGIATPRQILPRGTV